MSALHIHPIVCLLEKYICEIVVQLYHVMVNVLICKHLFILFMHATPVKINKPFKCMFTKMMKKKYSDLKPK